MGPTNLPWTESTIVAKKVQQAGEEWDMVITLDTALIMPYFPPKIADQQGQFAFTCYRMQYTFTVLS